MRTLVTGGHGFAGRHLAHHLVKCGDDVVLTYFGSPDNVDPCAEAVGIPRTCQSVALDVSDRDAVFQLVQVLKPEVVYHLAALTYVPDAERNPEQVYQTNFFGSLNVLDALREHAPTARCLLVSSAEVYGDPRPNGLPLTEQSELRPTNTYALGKSAADVAGYKYSYRDNLFVIRARPFPHIGPGQSERFAISGFAKQVAAIKLGQQEPLIKVGNLEPKRDYSDVSDIVRGYREAVLNGKSGEAYNLCSAESVSIGEHLEHLLKLANVEAEIQVDPERVREVDVAEMYGSYEKAQRHFGWKPKVEREAMLDSLLAFWLEFLSA